ncbi:primosomal protein N' (replication factor Y) - superfamily II helicase, partial [Amaricoccus sp.]|uniref:primosomal protein N' (replication factor Y) - superfamily II helicase n=1 Tax=Amaricoccus sp. TaxID=1872485 RepID=UPI002623DA41
MQLGPASGSVDGGAEIELQDHRFPCPSCGSDLRFDPDTDGLKCPHCGHQEPVPAPRRPIPELDLRAVEQGTLPPAEMQEARFARCPNCGAEVELGRDAHARECPFCATPIVTDTGPQRQIKPQAQLPFLLSEAKARAAMNHWLGRLWFAPNDLKQYARAERAMQGIYVPYWTYDAETRTQYSGQRGTVYYESRPVTVTVNGRRQTQMQQVARIRWQPVRGRVARDFDDVLVLGAKSLPKRFTDALAPWDLSVLSPYEPKFLAGFRAEGYTVPVEAGYEEARAIMNAVIERDVRADIGGDQQRIGDLRTEVGALTFKHVLLPVWLAAYRYRGRSFRFVVNGRTGTVEGERPWSTVKIAIAVAIALV